MAADDKTGSTSSRVTLRLTARRLIIGRRAMLFETWELHSEAHRRVVVPLKE